jgi:hypothetical protein
MQAAVHLCAEGTIPKLLGRQLINLSVTLRIQLIVCCMLTLMKFQITINYSRLAKGGQCSKNIFQVLPSLYIVIMVPCGVRERTKE